MTLTLELTPEQERRLMREAAALRMDIQAYALCRVLGETPMMAEPKPKTPEQIAKIRAVRGSLAHLADISSYQFIEDKKREMALEDMKEGRGQLNP